MNRTDRLLAIVLALQAKGERRAEDLAALFETSKRTIYRDIQALCEAGVPVIAMPGRGYMLDEGYFLPPLSFSIDEATLLLLGMDVMAESFDADYRRVAQMAQSKIEGVLPPFTRERAVWLRASLMFVAMDALNSAQIERLRQIRRAIFNQQRVRFVYHTRYPDDRAPEQRDADPYALVSVDGVWYLRGYCHLRRGLRIFRLSRISELQILAQTFQRPA
ncbi:MAG: YafY family transcriptional regulator, partial [Armatimonadetes bacterium]|nr:YafY family transcriptional regulator [Anaerolineae bacterium]